MANDNDVKHNHMYDVQQVQPSDYPSTAKAEKQMRLRSFRQVSFLTFSIFQFVHCREGESECRCCRVFDVLGCMFMFDVLSFNISCLLYRYDLYA